MRLSYQKAFLFSALLTMACAESTPPPGTVSRQYLLESINGQPLPALLSAAQADTTRILWATLSLDVAGNAYSADHWRRVYPPNQTEEATLALQLEYRITGDDITVGSFKPCPSNALCMGNKVGKITSTTLTLAYTDNPTAAVYVYRLMPID